MLIIDIFDIHLIAIFITVTSSVSGKTDILMVGQEPGYDFQYS